VQIKALIEQTKAKLAQDQQRRTVAPQPPLRPPVTITHPHKHTHTSTHTLSLSLSVLPNVSVNEGWLAAQMGPSGLATPLPSGMMTPLPSGMLTPLPSGMMTPLPTGAITPMGMGFQNQFGGNLGMLQARVQAQLAALKASGSLPGRTSTGQLRQLHFPRFPHLPPLPLSLSLTHSLSH
jgi:hypothetical protein